MFDGEFGGPVRRDRFVRVGFVAWEVLWFTIDRRRGGVNDTINIVGACSFEDRLRAVAVVLGDLGGVFDARPDARLGGLVIDHVDVFDDLVDEFFVRA